MPGAQPDGNLYELLEDRFRAAGDKIAFRSAGGHPLLSYRDLRHRVCRFANALIACGVGPGDRVSAQLDKSIAAVALYLAVLKVGAAYHPLNPDYTQHELDYFLSDAEPRLIVFSQARASVNRLLADRCGVRLETLDQDNAGSLARLAAAQTERHVTVRRSGDDLAGLLYTSGTTGRPKGAMITHANLATNAMALHRLWAIEPWDVLVHALPVFHVHGLHVALHTAFLGGNEILWLPRFDVGEIMQCLESATVMMGVPTFYTRLLAEPRFGRSACAGMRLFICGSAPLPAEVHAAFLFRTGHAILERYGMTETGMIASNPYDGERIAGSVGFPLPDVAVRIADGEGRELARGETGTIEVSGPNVFKGYWRAPGGSDFRDDGYFVTGDLGTMAADGRVSIVGRARDLIISGGLNVYPKEVEQALDRLPQIVESAVIGVPHPDLGEAVVAAITVAYGPASESEMINALGGSLARFKIPKRIFVVDELPRNIMGKVQKSELRSRYAGTFD